jgi:hypothetical protein
VPKTNIHAFHADKSKMTGSNLVTAATTVVVVVVAAAAVMGTTAVTTMLVGDKNRIETTRWLPVVVDC